MKEPCMLWARYVHRVRAYGERMVCPPSKFACVRKIIGTFPWEVPGVTPSLMWSRSMAFERVFARVLNKLPEGDAIALAAQRDKVIQLLHEELLAEGLLVGREGGGSPTASTQSGDVVASLQKGVSPSSGAESLKGIPFLYRDSINAYSYLIST